MALGISKAGFQHKAVLEFDPQACKTIRANQTDTSSLARSWPLVETDVRTFHYDSLRPGIDLLAGGPPCQPFSQGGKGRGHSDIRNMFPEAVRAVRELRPQTFIFENVNGLLRWGFAEYVDYLRLCFAYPEIQQMKAETWLDHHLRLERRHTSGAADCYRVVVRCVNAADYGVPQNRQRVIVVGIRSDLALDWQFPATTHSEDQLLRALWITGDYWDRHRIAKKYRPTTPKHLRSKIESARQFDLSVKPWRTVRDAIADLEHPRNARNGSGIANHDYIAGARTYAGHTGSAYDWPAKALKAGDHGVPGGENMLVHRNGRVRYFTVRECARLQTFPDDYIFEGGWRSSTRQLGNAVPVRLATTLALSLKKALIHQRMSDGT